MIWIENLGSKFLNYVEELGRMAAFFLEAMKWLFKPPFRYKNFIEQFIFIANKSLFIVCLTSIFAGMVFAVQVYFGFKIINADALVGPTTAIAFVRELGPVFTAIVVTGRCGAAMAAQLGTMRVTEQIDAMDVMAVSSMQYLVTPRIIASMIGLPLLTTLFIYVGNIGSYFTGSVILRIDPVLYFSHLQEFVEPKDLAQGLIKAAIFGIIFATVGTYKGYKTQGGAEAVGKSTNEAVVLTLVLILVSDYFLTMMIRSVLYSSGL